MSCFSTVSAVTANSELDLTKHVNYTAGMILGVDDFTQEFAYLAGRDRWLARDAIGYGTISGLSIHIEEDAEKGFRVMVHPGVAVSPRGQFICVPTAQCAYLNQWLAAADIDDLDKWVQRGNVSPPISSPPVGDELMLYVVLCYRDCLADNVPIPGEPCRSEDELTAASRIKDDFSLELRFEAPKQAEEDSVREYVEWLKQITVTETEDSTPINDFISAIRKEWLSADDEDSEDDSPEIPEKIAKLSEKAVKRSGSGKVPLKLSSAKIENARPTTAKLKLSPAREAVQKSVDLRKLKALESDLQINTNDFCEYMRAAFRLWVTELRNVLSERKTGCAVEMTGGSKIEDCVLLAELQIPVQSFSPGWKVSDTEEIKKHEENRPFLLHLRMLQEWMLCGGCNCVTEGGTITSPPPVITSPSAPHDHSLDSLTDVTAASPTDGQYLVYRGSEWVAEDHPVTPVNSPPTPIALDALTDVTVPTPAEGQILIFRGGQWIAENPTIVPPVAIALDNLTDVVVPSPTEGQILIFRSNRWISQNLPAAPVPAITLDNLTDVVVPTPAEGQVLTFRSNQWISQNLPVVPPPSIALDGLTDVVVPTPAEGQVLTFRNNQWVAQTPATAPTPTAKPELILPLATVTRIDNNIYEIWFHIDAPGNLARVSGFKEGHLQIFDETNNPTTFTSALNEYRFRFSTITTATPRNVFVANLTLQQGQIEPDRMRFRFDIGEIMVEPNSNRPSDTMSLLEYARRNNIQFTGFLEGQFVTVFVRGLANRIT